MIRLARAARSTALMAAAMLVGGLVLAAGTGPAGATATFSFLRFAGTDRYDTARLVAESTFQAGSATALLANGTLAHFPDALAASYLAGRDSAPILLTQADSVPIPTDQALATLKVQNVIIIGQTSAVSDAVASHLAGEHYNVSRLGGQTRYDTAASVAATPGASAVGAATAIVASGANFPDALAAGPIADAKAFPVVLTDPAALSPQAAQTLKDLGIKNVIIAGGTAAVSTAVESQITGMAITTQRVAGQDRTDTAAQLAAFAVQSLGFDKTKIDLARGDDPADSLSGAPFGATYKTALLLTESPTTLGNFSTTYLTSNAPTLANGYIFGGSTAVSPTVQDTATTEAQTGSAPPGPKLAMASIKSGDHSLQLTYNEAVLCASVDANATDFTVTNGTSPDNPTAAACANPVGGTSPNITLTLPTAPAAGDTLTATVQAGTDGDTVADPNGGLEATGDSTSTSAVLQPILTSAAANVGTTSVGLTYNEPIVCSSVDANGSDFTVTVANGADAVVSASCTGTTSQSVNLALATALTTTGQSVVVTAAPGTDHNTVLDSGGQSEPTGDSVTTATIKVVPTMVAATFGAGTNMTTTYNEPVQCTSVNPGDYSVSDTPSGSSTATSLTVSTAKCTGTGTASTTVAITLASGSAPGATDTVTIAATSTTTVADSNGNTEFPGDHVNATYTVPKFAGVIASDTETTIVVTYDEPIHCTSVDANGSDYQVSVTGKSDNPTSATCLNATTDSFSSTVSMEVPTPPTTGQQVTVLAQNGSMDGDTVTDNNGSTQPVGNNVSTITRMVPLLVSVDASPGSTSATLTYNEPVTCSTVDSDGSDYTATLTPTASETVIGATCSGGTSAQVTLTLFLARQQGQTLTISAKVGTDGDTVLDSSSRPEPTTDARSTVPKLYNISASNGSTTVTVTLTQVITCASLDGSDYLVKVTPSGGTQGIDAVNATACSSPVNNGSSVVTLTVTTAPTANASVLVIAQAGTDHDTVIAQTGGGAEPSGDSLSGTAT